MPIVMIILNVFFVLLVLGVIVGAHMYAVATQHRDHGAVAAGQWHFRRVWSERRRRSRPVQIERRGQSARRGQPWPAS